MSRRRGEFEHRTSIFEGAFRAWSHLGGLDPVELENKAASDLDPLTNPIENDPRLSGSKGGCSHEGFGVNADGSKRREYPYEPLPRSGLAHPYVQAILSPWLGPDADNEAIQLGLTTLRTWWQHRRKGESGSAIAALGTEKMKGVVEGYTRHFFTLAHCLVTNDKEQPPRSLHTKMKELEKIRSKRNKKRVVSDEMPLPGVTGAPAPGGGFGGTNANPDLAALNETLTDSTLSPLERLHEAQRRQLEKNGTIHSSLPGGNNKNNNNSNGGNSMTPMGVTSVPQINMKGKCVPGKMDMGGLVDTVNHHATQLAHRGSSSMNVVSNSNSNSSFPTTITSSSHGQGPDSAPSSASANSNPSQYGDPTTTPVVFVSENSDVQIAMTVDGITCAHCVKIVETVLRGCNGSKSPIDGLLDAAADRALCMVLIKIDKSSNAKRVAFEAARNLAMVGYTAKAKEMSIVVNSPSADKNKATMDLNSLCTAFEIVANTDAKKIFNWNISCACPDNGVLREDCARHSQMNTRIFEAFDSRQRKVTEYMAGSGNFKHKNESMQQEQQHNHHHQQQKFQQQQNFGRTSGMDTNGLSSLSQQHDGMMEQPQHSNQLMAQAQQQQHASSSQQRMNHQQQQTQQQHQPLDVFPDPYAAQQQHSHHSQQQSNAASSPDSMGGGMPDRYGGGHGGGGMGGFGSMSRRNNSIISFGNNLRSMSVTSETTFGRAMSGLSALSIDWETLEDFDVNVDHSSHINNNLGSLNNNNLGMNNMNNGNNIQTVSFAMDMPMGGSADRYGPAGGVGVGGVGVGVGGGVPRRSSMRKPFIPGSGSDQTGGDGPGAHVSFKV